MTLAKQLGKTAEAFAQSYLIQQGLQLLAQNYQCRKGEIDLIMQEQDCIIFIEVRYRRNTAFGNSSESISLAKRHKIIATARYYLQQYQLYEKVPCRFDVIAIVEQNNEMQIEWIKHAFEH